MSKQVAIAMPQRSSSVRTGERATADRTRAPKARRLPDLRFESLVELRPIFREPGQVMRRTELLQQHITLTQLRETEQPTMPPHDDDTGLGGEIGHGGSPD